MRAENKGKHVPRRTLEFSAAKLALFKRSRHVVSVLAAVSAYHVDIVLRPYHRGKVVLVRFTAPVVDVCPPVGHGETCKAPLVAEYSGVQVDASRSPQVVDLAVGGHYGLCTALFDSYLKAPQVYLPQRPLADCRIKEMPVRFLIVAAEMLYRALNAYTVQTFQFCRRHLAREERVLREILEVPAVQRVTVYIHSGTQQAVYLVGTHLKTHHREQFSQQRLVQGCRDKCAVGQAESLCAHIKAHARRSVRTAPRRHFQFSQPV